MKLTGAQALIKSLEMEAVEVVFGLPGGCILPAYDPLLDSPIRHVLVRHEQGAGHMAEGYAHVTGRPGVAMVTSGPAATNMVTPLMDAYMDSVPLVVITGQVATGAIGSDAFQECDTVGITRSTTKHNELVMTAQDIPMAVRQAFHIATTGRPGPTLIDVPKDCLINTMDWYWPTDEEVAASLPGYRPTMKGHPRMIKEAAKMILASERPIIYAGGGILKARAADALREFACVVLARPEVDQCAECGGDRVQRHERAEGLGVGAASEQQHRDGRGRLRAAERDHGADRAEPGPASPRATTGVVRRHGSVGYRRGCDGGGTISAAPDRRRDHHPHRRSGATRTGLARAGDRGRRRAAAQRGGRKPARAPPGGAHPPGHGPKVPVRQPRLSTGTKVPLQFAKQNRANFG